MISAETSITANIKKTKKLASRKTVLHKRKYGETHLMISGIFDCAIVGAGPAGATAALVLARAGRRVILFEKERLPRVKPCGGGVSPEVFSLLGIEAGPQAGVVASVSEAEILFNGQHPFSCRLKRPCLMVDRGRFDHHLVSLAAAMGAEICDGTTVTGFSDGSFSVAVETTRGSVAARFVIIADGGQGRTARKAGFETGRNRVEGIAVAEEVPAGGVGRIVIDIGMIPCGYTWLFPKGDRFSIGLGITKRDGNHRFIFERLRCFADRCGVPFDRLLLRGARLGLWSRRRIPSSRGPFLLAGEAACLVDPLCAEGIRPAVKSGIMGGAAVIAALDGDGSAFDRYETALQETFDRHFAVAARIAQFFFLFPFLSYRAVFSRPDLGVFMSRVFLGEVSYDDIAHKALGFLRRTIAPRTHEQ